MRPVQHHSNNDVLRPPAGATSDECRPLAITRVLYANGVSGVWSFWQPNEAELRALQAGAPVRLSCLGTTHPPVLIDVDVNVGAGT